MTEAEYRAVVDFEQNLQVGDTVRICWTCCGTAYAAVATVTKINAKSILAAINDAIESDYPKGQVIKAPRIESFRTWSVNNRVEPVGGYEPVEV